MKNIGKWIYNAGSSDDWYCDEEFDTKEEAIKAGKEYIKEEYGLEYVSGFVVGRIVEPNIHISPSLVIDNVLDSVSWDCGDVADNWLYKVSKEDETLLDSMINKVFREWLDVTNNKPTFYMIEDIEEISMEDDMED